MPRLLTARRLAVLVPVLLALLAFAVTLGGGFVYDDQLVFDVQKDDRLRDPGQWHRYLFEPYHEGPDNLYRPAASLSFAVVWWLFGESPMPQHAVNWLLHAVISGMVAVLALRLQGPRIVAAVAGGLFALHPIHVEAVAGLIGRFELLCTLGTLGVCLMLCPDRPLNLWRAAPIVGWFALAILSKEQGMIVPVLAGLLAFARRLGGETLTPAAKPGAVAVALGLGGGLAGFVLLKENVLGLPFWWDRTFLEPYMQPMVLSEGLDRWLMPLVVLGWYTKLLLWPTNLSLDYGGDIIGHQASPADPHLWLGAAIFVAWAATVTIATAKAVAACRRPREEGSCDSVSRSPAGARSGLRLAESQLPSEGNELHPALLLWLLAGAALTYLPAANLLTIIGTIFGERLAYLPSVFVCLLMGFALTKLPRRGLIVLVLLIGPALAWQTVAYAVQWSDPRQLYRDQSAARPGGMRVALLAGTTAREAGDLEEAMHYADRAAEAWPRSHLPHVLRAWVWLEMDRPDDAEAAYVEAVRRQPGTAQALGQMIRSARAREGAE
jgi:hypothetical protein